MVPSRRPVHAGFIGRLLRIPELGLVLALLIICGAVTMREPRFLQSANLEQVALSATLVCIVTLGEAVVIIARQVDLSIGAMVAASAFISAGWLEHHPDGFHLLGDPSRMCGWSRARCRERLAGGLFRIPAIVATLGTLAIYRGGVIVFAGGRQISATVLPDSYGDIARIHLAGAPLLVWVALLLTVGVRVGNALSPGQGETSMRSAATRRARGLSASTTGGI